MDWRLVDVERLQELRCPSCQRALGGGLMRQVEWSARRCVVVVACPTCGTECMAILETRLPRLQARPPIDVEAAHAPDEFVAGRHARGPSRA